MLHADNLTCLRLHQNDVIGVNQGRSDGDGYWYLYPPKSAQVNFLWGKNDVRTAIQQFYTPQKNLYPPKTNFWLRPWCKQDFCVMIRSKLHFFTGQDFSVKTKARLFVSRPSSGLFMLLQLVTYNTTLQALRPMRV